MPYERPEYAQSRVRRRLFSASGRFVGVPHLVHAVPSLVSAAFARFAHIYPRRPFIPYAAAAALDRRLSPRARVVEIGAGMSTLWLSRRVAHVTSYEWNPVWYDRLRGHLDRERVSNVDLRFSSGQDGLAFGDVPDDSLDVIYVDGGPRSLCLERLWPKLKFGGLAYLDNWDSDLFWLEGGINARDFLDRRAGELAERLLFVDFVPGAFSVNEGLLVTKGHRASK